MPDTVGQVVSPIAAPGVLRAASLGARGAPHAFTTRPGGVSRGLFSTLNFGNPSGLPAPDRDPPANIRANFDRVMGALEPGLPAREIVEVHQVHGAAVHIVRTGGPPHAGADTTKADAVVTDDPGRFVVVRVADCAPVLLSSGDGRIVAAVHAGWRGTVAGVVPAAVDAMRSLGARDIAGAVGPCIGFEAFEVGPEVAVEFRRVFGGGTAIVRAAMRREAGAPDGKCLVDLKSALCEQLERAGVGPIDVLPHCTVRDRDLFFSHRRDGGLTGRMIGLIGPSR